MNKLSLKIVTPSKLMFAGEIESVTLPGTAGGFQVLVNHAPLISSLEVGIIKVVLPSKEVNYYTTSGGTVEVLDNNVRVLADSLENVNDIDKERANLAKERAQKRLADRSDKSINLSRADFALKRAVNRLQAVEKYIKSEV